MGYPMAGHLAAAGHAVTVFNRTSSVAERWIGEHPGSAASSPREAAEGADVAFTIVGNDDDVRSVVLGDDGVLAGLGDGTVLVDHTTASAALAVELHSAAGASGVGFVDAPVSGGESGAQNGALTVMCGGDEAVFERVAPLIDCYSRLRTLIGPPGSGQLTKMCNQIAIAGIVQGLSEALNFGQRAGLDTDRVLDTISAGAAGSWQMENRGRTMCAGEFEFGFAVDWIRKDLAICFDEANRNGARLPAAALIDQFYAAVQAHGGGRWDTSSLITLLTD